jgi:cyclopropane-fatty-acyl-phospholipid synthase
MAQSDVSISEKKDTTQQKDLSATRNFLDLVFPPPRSFPIRLWDGTILPPAGPQQRNFGLVIKFPGSLHRMFKPPIENSIGEAFMVSDFDIEGDILEAVSLIDVIAGKKMTTGQILQLYRAYLALPRSDERNVDHRGPAQLSGTRHSQHRDETAVQYHYDVSNEFYSLWLGKRMQYSCAYFITGDEDIDTAQEQKLEHICRKLRLQPGERLLDIGCGWGGLAIYAAEKFGASVVGISLSKNQVKYASEQVQKMGLSGQVDIRSI